MVANTVQMQKTANIVQILGRKREEDGMKMFSFGTPQITAWWGSLKTKIGPTFSNMEDVSKGLG